LIWFGFIFAAAAAGGRGVVLGLSNASFSLYVIYDVLILVGAYLVIVDRFGEIAPGVAYKPRWLLVASVSVALLVGLQLVLGTVNGIANGRSYRSFETTGATVMTQVQRAPAGLVENQLGAGYETAGFIRQMTAFLRVKQLSLFSTSAAASYARLALPVNTTPPTTQLLKPTSQQSLHGDVFLTASAYNYFGITSVQFAVRGDGRPAILLPGVRASFGWLGAWDTGTVPNGRYEVRSVAVAPGGLRGTSPWTDVTVTN
jgi:Bacterial Ig domain